MWDRSYGYEYKVATQEEQFSFLLPPMVARLAKAIINEMLAKLMRTQQYQPNLLDVEAAEVKLPRKFRWTIFVKYN